MTTTDRDELIALYAVALERFRTARRVLTDHGNGTSAPTTIAELQAEADARARMLELRALWPGWIHT
jgi:hypothetical protein